MARLYEPQGKGDEMNPRSVLKVEKNEINVPIALSAPRDGDQGPSKVTKTELCAHTSLVCLPLMRLKSPFRPRAL